MALILQSCRDDLKTKTTYFENKNVETIEYINSKGIIEKKIHFTIDGNKFAEFEYKNGIIDVSFLYNKEEELISKFFYFKDNYCERIDYDKGNIIGKGKLDENLIPEGTWEYFDENGKFIYKITFPPSNK